MFWMEHLHIDLYCKSWNKVLWCLNFLNERRVFTVHCTPTNLHTLSYLLLAPLYADFSSSTKSSGMVFTGFSSDYFFQSLFLLTTNFSVLWPLYKQTNKLFFPLVDCSYSERYISYQDSIFLRCNIHRVILKHKTPAILLKLWSWINFSSSEGKTNQQGTHYLWGPFESFVILDLTLLIHSISVINMVKRSVMLQTVFYLLVMWLKLSKSVLRREKAKDIFSEVYKW